MFERFKKKKSVERKGKNIMHALINHRHILMGWLEAANPCLFSSKPECSL